MKIHSKFLANHAFMLKENGRHTLIQKLKLVHNLRDLCRW